MNYFCDFGSHYSEQNPMRNSTQRRCFIGGVSDCRGRATLLCVALPIAEFQNATFPIKTHISKQFVIWKLHPILENLRKTLPAPLAKQLFEHILAPEVDSRQVQIEIREVDFQGWPLAHKPRCHSKNVFF